MEGCDTPEQLQAPCRMLQSPDVLLMLAGGVDEIVDWSKTAPKRKFKRPADTAGDFDDKVRHEQQA